MLLQVHLALWYFHLPYTSLCLCFNNTHEGLTPQQFPNYFNLPAFWRRFNIKHQINIKHQKRFLLRLHWALEFKVQLLKQAPGIQDWCLVFFFKLDNFTGLDDLSKTQHWRLVSKVPPKQKYSQQKTWAKNVSFTREAENLFTKAKNFKRTFSVFSNWQLGFAHGLQTKWSIQSRRSRTPSRQRQNHNVSKHCEVSVISILSLITVFDVFSLPVSCFRCWLLITLISPLFSVHWRFYHELFWNKSV